MMKIKTEARITDYISEEELDNIIKNNEILKVANSYEVLDNMIIKIKTDMGYSYYKIIKNDDGSFEAYFIDKDGKKLGDEFVLFKESKKLKTEAIYLVTPDEKTGAIDLDQISNVVNELTDTVKANDATDVAQDAAEIPAGEDSRTEEAEVIDISKEDSESPVEIVDEYAIEETPAEVINVMDVEEPDATDMIMDTASVPGDGITSDIQADEMEPIPSIETSNGPMFVLAEQLISAYHTISSLHRNLNGGAWFDNHEKLEDYTNQVALAVDEVIEQNIALGGREPSAKEALDAFPTYEIVGRDKNDTYRIVREVFNAIISLIEECKSGIPGDVISKLEEMENYFRKEAEYKIAKTVLGEAKLMTKEEMKAEKLVEAKLAQAKSDAKKDALETGDDMYLYQDGEEVYYTDESPKKNPKLFDRVKLLGKFVTDMKDGKMTVTYVAENFEKKAEYVSNSKFRKRINEEKIGDNEIPDTMGYIGPNNNPELQKISGDKISFEDYKKQFKDEIDNSYKTTYGDEIDNDLYNALADYMYNDSITGNVQTKEDYIDPIEETEPNKDLVNDEGNKDEHKEGK